MNLAALKVLIVDDINAVRIQIRDLLHEFGFINISTATSGAQAKEMVNNEHFDLILCDWHMEGVDGIEVLIASRTSLDNSQTRFLMVTGETRRDKVIEAIKHGVDDYLIKPLTLETLQEKVLKVLEK